LTTNHANKPAQTQLCY